MRRLIIAAIVILSIAGCENLPPKMSEAKQAATGRWNSTRAEMVCAVAREQFRTGNLDVAATEARKALAMDEKCLQARLLLAKVMIEKGRNVAACAELEKALEHSPELPEAFYLLGVAQERADKLPESLEAYRRAYELDQSNLAPVCAIAEVLVRMGRTREAQLHDEVDLFELGGRLAMMAKEYDKAASYYQRALDVDVANRFYRERLGRAQYLAGMYAEAVDTLESFLRDPYGREPSPWVHATLGDCYMAMSKPSHARQAYQHAADKLKSSAAIRASLAKAILAERQYARAAVTAKEALVMDTQCLDAALVLGYALLLDGQANVAVRELTAAAADHPEDSTLWCLLGRAYDAAGDREKAVKCYTTALRADPTNALARELLDGMTSKELSRK